MEFAQPKPFEVPIEIDCFEAPVEIGKKVLIVDDESSFRRRGQSGVMATMAGIMAMAESFGGIAQPRHRWKTQHVRHQGAKELARRAKQLAKQKAT